MKLFWLTIRYALCLAVLAATGCKRKAEPETVPQVTEQASTPAPITPVPTATPTPEKTHLEQLAEKIRPAVILITVFDPAGNLLRSGTGFFISDNGRIITASRTIEGAVNAVAKTADGGLYNISNVLVHSTKLDLAVLNADVKTVPFLPLAENAKPEPGTQVAVIGSSLAGSEGAPVEGKIAGNGAEESQNQFGLVAQVPEISLGAPVVGENGDVIGVVTERDQKEEGSTVIQSVNAVKSVVEEIQPNATARWPGEPRPTPTPRPRLVYTPKPIYPSEARFSDGVARSGRYRVNFNADGTVKNVQVLNSTGVEALDAASIKGLGQWKCEPGHEGFVIVPLTFKSR